MHSFKALFGLLLSGLVFVSLPGWSQQAQRTTLSLNGSWDVDESIGPDDRPQTFGHKVPVPGLTHSAIPAFPDVDQYQTRQLLSNLVRQGTFPRAEYEALGDARGVSHQRRNYFWYRTTFPVGGKRAVAILKIGKAQFGAVAYLNGERIGEHAPCFTAAYFDVTRAIRWNAPNELVIRIGATPGVLPADVSQGTDFEKNRWTPGIYDNVSLQMVDNPVISTVQVAPQLATSSILVETEVRNYTDHVVVTHLKQAVTERKSGHPAAPLVFTRVEVPAASSISVRQTVRLTHPHLWNPDDPFLYEVKTSTSGDHVDTRFGMREFRFDTATQRAYLNGRPYFLRGSNITLHRFFEDPDVGTRPWDEAWVHKLLVEIPKKLHWNTFRFCIGPVPDRWLEIADESGLLIQNEYMVWTGHPTWTDFQAHYDTAEMITEYKEWMRDNWNHPSVAIWDATNESLLPEFTNRIIPAVRSLDLSNRPWENSYNAPSGPDDPVEDHPYLWLATAMADVSEKESHNNFKMTDLESLLGPPSSSVTSKTAHAMILNEYGWLWLNRDGTPTLLTQKLYPKLLGEHSTAETRFTTQAYLLGGETEFWRAYRRYAGVLHFVYLTASDPKAFTSDHFRDVKTLELEPHFLRAMEQAFNPLGVYLNFWQPTLVSGDPRDYTVTLINDEDRPRSGALRLSFVSAESKEIEATEVPFSLTALGAQSYTMHLKAPTIPGAYSLRAVETPGDQQDHPTTSRRDVTVQASTVKH